MMNTFPHCAPHQLIVDMANSAQETIELLESAGHDSKLLRQHHAQITTTQIRKYTSTQVHRYTEGGNVRQGMYQAV